MPSVLEEFFFDGAQKTPWSAAPKRDIPWKLAGVFIVEH